MQLRPGLRLKAAADDTEVVVVRAPGRDADLGCGGLAMLAPDAERAPSASPDPGLAGGSALGKRYVDGTGELEVLCTKAGTGTLTLDGVALVQKEAKALPASD